VLSKPCLQHMLFEQFYSYAILGLELPGHVAECLWHHMLLALPAPAIEEYVAEQSRHLGWFSGQKLGTKLMMAKHQCDFNVDGLLSVPCLMLMDIGYYEKNIPSHCPAVAASFWLIYQDKVQVGELVRQRWRHFIDLDIVSPLVFYKRLEDLLKHIAEPGDFPRSSGSEDVDASELAPQYPH